MLCTVSASEYHSERGERTLTNRTKPEKFQRRVTGTSEIRGDENKQYNFEWHNKRLQWRDEQSAVRCS